MRKGDIIASYRWKPPDVPEYIVEVGLWMQYRMNTNTDIWIKWITIHGELIGQHLMLFKRYTNDAERKAAMLALVNGCIKAWKEGLAETV